jgi:hypothetical protein
MYLAPIALRRMFSESRMRENRPSGLMRGGEFRGELTITVGSISMRELSAYSTLCSGHLFGAPFGSVPSVVNESWIVGKPMDIRRPTGNEGAMQTRCGCGETT